jgi:hypothetical protein
MIVAAGERGGEGKQWLIQEKRREESLLLVKMFIDIFLFTYKIK